MTIADSEPVKKVRKALKDAGLADNVVELDAPMENAADTAKALDTEPGAVVTSRARRHRRRARFGVDFQDLPALGLRSRRAVVDSDSCQAL